MEINTNLSAGGVNSPILPQRSVALKPAWDETSFGSSVALERALKNLPESRSARVERARSLIGTVNYPPQETIRKISHLLAIKLESDTN